MGVIFANSNNVLEYVFRIELLVQIAENQGQDSLTFISLSRTHGRRCEQNQYLRSVPQMHNGLGEEITFPIIRVGGRLGGLDGGGAAGSSTLGFLWKIGVGSLGQADATWPGWLHVQHLWSFLGRTGQSWRYGLPYGSIGSRLA
jgi:hypothetical protein